jgi:hypothetical protein
MDWDQIEAKWAAMTRRIRADWPTSCQTSRATTGRHAEIVTRTEHINARQMIRPTEVIPVKRSTIARAESAE